MKVLAVSVAAMALLPLAASAGAPPDRPLTDPRTVVSAPHAAAPAPPVAALFGAFGGHDAAWSADDKAVIVSTNLSGRYNLWLFPRDGGEPTPLTRSDERQDSQVVSPDGATVIYESDFGGAERYDLFAVPIKGGTAVNLTRTPDVSETNPLYSPDGRLLAFSSKPKTQPASNVAVMDLATRQTRLLTHETEPTLSWQLVGWAANGRALIANRANLLGTRCSVWRIEVATGRAQQLTPRDDACTAASDLSPDGRHLAVSSDAGGEQRQAALLDLTTHQLTWLDRSPWEQGTSQFSRDGRTLLFTTNADGRTALALYDLASGAVHPVTLPEGVNAPAGAGGSAFSRDSHELLVSHQSSTTPFDYWIYDIPRGEGHRLTHLGPAGFDPAVLPASQLVHYRSADGTVISAFLWAPDGLKRDGHAPGIVLPHGGPTGQTVDTFNRTAIALVSRGYVVIAPNVRGSTGYGRAFQLMNIKDLGGGDLTDEVHGAGFLVQTGHVDAKRIGITGGSYGGYMTLMAIGKTPDVWRAAVEQYGIIDWRTMLAHEDPVLQEYEKSLLGDPVKDAAVYTNDSPITFIRQARAPLLVLQGDNDIRVPREEAEQVVAILQKEGRTVQAHYYPNEGHGFAKTENQIDALERTVAWFEQHLKAAN